MLRVSSDCKEADLDLVDMPSSCLRRFRGNFRGETLEGHLFYWVIQYLTPKERVAHLVRSQDIEQYRKPGFRTVVPAYRKAQP